MVPPPEVHETFGKLAQIHTQPFEDDEIFNKKMTLRMLWATHPCDSTPQPFEVPRMPFALVAATLDETFCKHL